MEPLASVLLSTIRDGDRAVLEDRGYLRALGFPGSRATAGEVWQHLAGQVLSPGALDADAEQALGVILRRGPLARRLVEAIGTRPTRLRLRDVYAELCGCLVDGRSFAP